MSPQETEAAAIVTAAVVRKMTFAADADVLRDAIVAFRKISRALSSVDEKNEEVTERRQRRIEQSPGDRQRTEKGEARRQARLEVRGAKKDGVPG